MRRKSFLLVSTLLLSSSISFAGDIVFFDQPYLQMTKRVVKEADAQAAVLFSGAPASYTLYVSSRDALLDQIEKVERARIFKKLKADNLVQEKNVPFKDALNGFKAHLSNMIVPPNRSPASYLPSFAEWNRTENALDQAATDQRLLAYETRFGPDSEPINIVELFIGEKFLPGDKMGPSAWEPIFRVSAVQATNQGSGVTSTMEWGANYYYLDGRVPKPFKWIGVSNHVGAALALQYRKDSHILNFEGRPSFGVMFHLDRKEAGLTWDPDEDKIRLTLGYAFQFVPLAL